MAQHAATIATSRRARRAPTNRTTPVRRCSNGSSAGCTTADWHERIKQFPEFEHEPAAGMLAHEVPDLAVIDIIHLLVGQSNVAAFKRPPGHAHIGVRR